MGLRTRTTITVADVNQAKLLAGSAGRKARDIDDWADVRNPGLLIRVAGKSAKWLLKHKGRTVTLAPAEDFSPATAREVADSVRRLLVANVDPKPYLTARRIGTSEKEAFQAAVEAARPPEERGWTWKDLADRYLVDWLSIPKKGNPPSRKTITDVTSLWANPAFKTINGTYIRDLTRGDIERVRDRILKHSGGTRSNRAVGYIQAAFNWAARYHSAASGLGDAAPWWRMVAKLHDEEARSRKRTRTVINGVITDTTNCLTIAEVGKLLAVMEADRRSGCREISTGVYWGLWWVALSGQRKMAGTGLLKSRVVPDPDHEGWHLALFPAAEMKKRRDHLLPIPPKLFTVLEQARRENEERARNKDIEPSAYFFPAATNKARKTGLPHDVPISDSAINQRIAAMRRSKMDPLEGLPQFTLHSLRTSLNTALSDKGFPGSWGSAILGHDMIAGNGEERSASDGARITRQVYDESQFLAQKRQGLDYWVDAVWAAYESAKAGMRSQSGEL